MSLGQVAAVTAFVLLGIPSFCLGGCLVIGVGMGGGAEIFAAALLAISLSGLFFYLLRRSFKEQK
jgi:hypothetical protein